jgi:hypothetical protein
MFCTNDSSHSLRVKIFRHRFDPVELSVSIDVWGVTQMASIVYILCSVLSTPHSFTALWSFHDDIYDCYLTV